MSECMDILDEYRDVENEVDQDGEQPIRLSHCKSKCLKCLGNKLS